MASTATTFDTDCKLMLHMDGSDASTTFTDSSTGAKTVTASGNAQIDIAQAKFAQSGLFDGTDDYLSVPDSDDWDFGTGDFTIDFWVRFAVDARQRLINVGDGFAGVDGVYIEWEAADSPCVYVNGNQPISRSFATSVDTWYHVAVTRSGTNLRLFIDGTQQGATATSSHDINGSTEGVVIGKTHTLSNFMFNGHIDELRIIKGTAVWTANFTPPVSAYTAPATSRNLALLGVG